jgi:L-fuconolactonase
MNNDFAAIDAHQHFWKFDAERDAWITEEMSVIRRDFMPSDLEPLLKENGFAGTVVVQSDQTEHENIFQLHNAEQHSFIKGVVGWIDLQAANVAERLDHYRQYPLMKGFRHVLQGEPQRDLMLRPEFKRGIGLLDQYGFTYDILIFPDQLHYTRELVGEFSRQKFVVDHIAKPYIKKGAIEEWKSDMEELARHENVWCKVSGMVTEADWKQWKKEDFRPYLDVVVNAFGTSRILFGSDWPVCLVAASYGEVVHIVRDYFSSFSKTEQEEVFGRNAQQFYQL